MYIGKTPTVGNFQVCDAISVVNGQAAYTLQVGGTNVAPESANHMLVSLNGILQKPGSSFTISGSTMTFASNLATGDVIDFVQILGNVLDIGQPSDDTVTAAKLNNDVISGQTALTSAPDDTDELLISDAGTIKRIDVSLVGGKNTPAFEAYTTGLQSITENSYVKMTFATEVFDTDNAYDNSSNYRFTPQVAGKYFVYAKGISDPSAYENGRTSILKIYKNGSAIEHTKYDTMTGGNTDSDGFTASTPSTRGIVDMNGSSDYLEAYFLLNTWNNSGANVGSKQFGAYRIIT